MQDILFQNFILGFRLKDRMFSSSQKACERDLSGVGSATLDTGSICRQIDGRTGRQMDQTDQTRKMIDQRAREPKEEGKEGRKRKIKRKERQRERKTESERERERGRERHTHTQRKN